VWKRSSAEICPLLGLGRYPEYCVYLTHPQGGCSPAQAYEGNYGWSRGYYWITLFYGLSIGR
jgi:hypothetical protein